MLPTFPLPPFRSYLPLPPLLEKPSIPHGSWVRQRPFRVLWPRPWMLKKIGGKVLSIGKLIYCVFFFWVGIFQLYLGIFCLVIDLNWFGPLGAKQNLGHQGEIKWAKQTLVTRVAVFAGQSFRFGENRWEAPPWETKVNQLNPNNTIIKPCQTKLKHHLNHDKTKTAQKRRYQKDAKS